MTTPFFFARHGLLALVALVALSFGGAAAAAPASTSAPEAVTSQVDGFYRFYLHALNTDADPLTKNRDTLKRYVSLRLLRVIDGQMKVEGGLEADPFICAQDFDKDWEKNIHLKDKGAEGKAWIVEVEFTGQEIKSHRVRLKLVKDAGTWKIDRVTDANPH